MTHDQLVDQARRWLSSRFGRSYRDPRLDARPGCPVVITEMTTLNPETPDVIGWDSEGTPIVVECKASRSDFRADHKKTFRQPGQIALGKLRYYMCPAGLIVPEQVPTEWGLLWVEPERVVLKKSASPFFKYDDGKRLLISALRRVRVDDTRVSVKVYTTNPNARATLTVDQEGKQ